MRTQAINEQERVRETVRAGYAAIAENKGAAAGCCSGSGCSGGELAVRIGYDRGELAALPDGAEMGLSCGNPTALAALQPGETVLDLGSGGGFDCYLAGPRVGPTGRVIGVDMTPEMVSRARRNLPEYRARSGFDNVEFRLGEIEHLPVADGSIDVLISNCVLNLAPDKPQVWREISRVLKPGGRVAVTDIALRQPLPETVRAMVEALVGCIAGAALLDDIRDMIAAAGLLDIELTPRPGYVEALSSTDDPLLREIIAKLPPGAQAADFITSVEISARKPSA